MKKLSDTLTERGIAFGFPLEIRDENDNVTYDERTDGYWYKCEYDANDNETYSNDSSGYWYRYERDANGRVTYYENSNGYWYKCEYDAQGNQWILV